METTVNSITNPNFFFGGKGKHAAIFTVTNVEKGLHHTFKIHASANGEVFWVYKLTGPDFYSFVGTIFNKFNPVVKPSVKSAFPANHVVFKIVEWSINCVIDHNLPDGYTIQHHGNCCRCGRVLTDPESIDRGIGPICAKDMGLK